MNKIVDKDPDEQVSIIWLLEVWVAFFLGYVLRGCV